jgi:integrase
LQIDKRSIEQRKWKPYSPEDVQRLFQAMQHFWGKPMRNMAEARRKAVWMAVRVQAFTAMRPKEVQWLEPDDVTDQWIRVRNSKTKDSDRVIPLHPEISDFPAFFHAGGFDTFKVQEKDRVQSVRHNFERLTRKLMDPPLDDPRQVLYSLRSTFSNAMRRAGADAEMRRAILGHAEAGALKHYDDGPEFAKKRKWVRATDPLKVYLDPGEDDDLGSDDEDD